MADGHDGWMEDFGEYTPPDLVSADGRPGRRAHNAYPVLYHRAAQRLADRDATPPLVRFVRSGWTGAARHAPVVWGGDPTVDWGFDGLRSAVRQGLSIGLSGVGLWGSDVGGFFALGERRLTRELLERWIELGALSGVMRTQANGFGRRAASARSRWTPRRCRSGARWPACARGCGPTSPRRATSTAAAACRSCATTRSRIPPTAC